MSDDIIRMAREAGVEFTFDPTESGGRVFAECWLDELERFAELVRADEREKRDEAVALLRKIHMGNESARSQDIIYAAISVLQRNAPEELAATIRARGNT